MSEDSPFTVAGAAAVLANIASPHSLTVDVYGKDMRRTLSIDNQVPFQSPHRNRRACCRDDTMNPRPLKKTAGDWWSVLVITHRYLGIAMSVPMLVWFVSGVVMIYVRYPHISEKERLRTLEPISWQACCRFGENVIEDHTQVLLAEVENQAGEDVLVIRSADDLDTAIDLVRGTPIQIDADRARAIALAAAQRVVGHPSPLIDADQIDGDQWTIGLAADAPLFRFAFGDADRTVVYVSKIGRAHV